MVHRPLRLRLDGDALVSNWRWLRARGGEAACGAAVKADGYGLGAREVVSRLATAGCRDFFVSTWAEAEALMPWDEGLNLSVLHGVGRDDLDAALNSPARPVLNSAEQVTRWRESGQGRPCDVMVDTGMNRLGLTPAQVGLTDGLTVETLMSHLACADEPGNPMNERQLGALRALAQEVPARRHSLANSAGICLGSDYAFDLTRPGLALYGGLPVIGDPQQRDGIRPVVGLEAQVVQIRTVPAGATIGYGAAFTAPRDLDVAILNVGYADGYLRQLADQGGAFGPEPLPILGRISMDLIAIAAPDGSQEGDWVRMDFNLEAMAGTLSQYELLTTLGHRYERIWV
jgi:alanine racemase